MSSRDDADTHADAVELFMVEATRVRLSERSGASRLALRSGVLVVGNLVATTEDRVDGHLLVIGPDGRRLLVATAGVAWIAGASTVLRDEGSGPAGQTLASRLRECWSSGARLRALLRDGRWLDASIALVAADHVELISAEEDWVIPFASVDVWDLGAG